MINKLSKEYILIKNKLSKIFRTNDFYNHNEDLMQDCFYAIYDYNKDIMDIDYILDKIENIKNIRFIDLDGSKEAYTYYEEKIEGSNNNYLGIYLDLELQFDEINLQRTLLHEFLHCMSTDVSYKDGIIEIKDPFLELKPVNELITVYLESEITSKYFFEINNYNKQHHEIGDYIFEINPKFKGYQVISQYIEPLMYMYKEELKIDYFISEECPYISKTSDAMQDKNFLYSFSNDLDINIKALKNEKMDFLNLTESSFLELTKNYIIQNNISINKYIELKNIISDNHIIYKNKTNNKIIDLSNKTLEKLDDFYSKNFNIKKEDLQEKNNDNNFEY